MTVKLCGYAGSGLTVRVTLRERIAAVCDSVVPSDYGDERFQTMTDGKYQEGFGSSCGFLVHFVLFMLGQLFGWWAADEQGKPVILNHDVPELGWTYTPGANIARLRAGAIKLGAWRTLADGVPDVGDLVLCTNGPPRSEHVFVFRGLGAGTWQSWDAGKTNDAGHQCARLDERHFTGRGLIFIGGEERAINGWVDVSALGVPAEASDGAATGQGVDPAAAVMVAALGIVGLAAAWVLL